jgi:hypothetical protein
MSQTARSIPQAIATSCAALLVVLPIQSALGQTAFEDRLRFDDPRAMAAPKTKLEALTVLSGQVLIKEFTETGKIESRGTVVVAAMILRNATSESDSK